VLATLTIQIPALFGLGWAAARADRRGAHPAISSGRATIAKRLNGRNFTGIPCVIQACSVSCGCAVDPRNRRQALVF
jgi:hypothetical protein